MFTKKDLEQLHNQGLDRSEIENQLRYFEEGFPPLKLLTAATPNHGINVISEEDFFRLTIVYENFLLSGLKSMKFVPASGAASRMFKNLFEFVDKIENGANFEQLISQDNHVQEFLNNIHKFPFYENLKEKIVNQDDKIEWIKKLLFEDGLNYGNQPKGLMAFHHYGSEFRTPFEEQLVETISYCTGSDGISKIHLTISPEHLGGFESLLNKVKNSYQKRYGVHLDVSFSFQHKSTDTIAVDLQNKPFRDENKKLIFRPGGHGTLLENLSELNADIIFIKNIDNVVPDRLKSITKQNKKALAGYLISLRNKIFEFLEKLDYPKAEENEILINKLDHFIKKELQIDEMPSGLNLDEKIKYYRQTLNRPIRICGMVKNSGEPGGGPFWVESSDKKISLQIVEKNQIDLSDEKQAEIFNQSTHFNPVDLICSTKDYKGNRFDLKEFIDYSTGFISIKSKDGKEMKVLEHPGLWNGSMSKWITIFIEVPIITFNPVKTINDLLRPEHQ